MKNRVLFFTFISIACASLVISCNSQKREIRSADVITGGIRLSNGFTAVLVANTYADQWSPVFVRLAIMSDNGQSVDLYNVPKKMFLDNDITFEVSTNRNAVRLIFLESKKYVKWDVKQKKFVTSSFEESKSYEPLLFLRNINWVY